MNKAVFLDRDGTIIKDKHYAFLPESIEFLPGVISGLKRLHNASYLLIIITNQSGIARGYFTEEHLKKFNDALLCRLKDEEISIDAIYYCPHYINGTIKKYAVECNCRKPKTGLFYIASTDFNIDFSSSYAIGDSERDCGICYVTQCRGCVLDGNKSAKDELNHFENFQQCVDFIINNEM